MVPGRILHNIQLDIVAKLCEESPLRFTQLHPHDIPNNVFSYHLKKLLETGYIFQNDDAVYEPTRKARKLLSYVDESTRHTTAPKLLTMLLIKNTEGKVLLLKRTRQPFPNWYGLPSGMVHFGERLEDSARRELAEKTGIRSSRPLRFIGVLDFQYLQSESNDIFVYSYVLKKSFDNQSLDSEYVWSDLNHEFILPEVNAVKLMEASSISGVTSVSFAEPQNMRLTKAGCLEAPELQAIASNADLAVLWR
jgi:ADP-ribose pyrophosphatase YjhB (NUDIX family)